VSPRVIVLAIGLANLMLFGASANEAAAPIAVVETTQDVPLAPSTLPPAHSISMLPTFTPLGETLAGSEEAPRAGYAAAALPALTPQRSLSSLPTVPSPLAQGCAITDERRFTVLAPDPQRLDHDGDGIGCEPIS
jgi:hypothetical protein